MTEVEIRSGKPGPPPSKPNKGRHQFPGRRGEATNAGNRKGCDSTKSRSDYSMAGAFTSRLRHPGASRGGGSSVFLKKRNSLWVRPSPRSERREFGISVRSNARRTLPGCRVSPFWIARNSIGADAGTATRVISTLRAVACGSRARARNPQRGLTEQRCR